MDKNNSNVTEQSGILEGRNPILEALKAGRDIDKILYLKGATEGSIKKILSIARDKGIVTVEADKFTLDKLSVLGSHQGVVAYIPMHQYVTLDDILKIAEDKGEKPFIIILDEITDPHNLGAIIRTANCAGAHGIIIPKRHSVGLTAVVAKTSSGAIEYTKVCKVSNIVQTIEILKEKGLWIYGADMAGEDYAKVDFGGSIAIVIGSEGKGISRIIKENCDYLVKIPMYGEISSLNASVAAGIIMFEAAKARNK